MGNQRKDAPLIPTRGIKKVPVPEARNGDCALLLLDLNQQPFD